MANVTNAVDQAARVGEIGFADFTAQLVRDVFQALMETNIQQTQTYIELVERVGQGLTAYINSTSDDIGAEEIAQFIALLSDTIQLEAGQSLTQEQADQVNDAIETDDEAGVANNNRVATSGQLDEATITTIRGAIAKRIAMNRFTLLQTVVRQGITRLVVDHGVIESRLTFNTYSRAEETARSSRRNASGMAAGFVYGGGLGILAGPGAVGFGGVGGFGGFSLTTSTASKLDRDVSGSRVQIFGRVEIHFKTDYVPLAS